MIDYDSELRRHQEVLLRALGIRADHCVLDIGCGTGQTTRDAARTAHGGQVVGIDPSAPALQQAQAATHKAGFRNVSYVRGDAAVAPFRSATFDVAISRFGTMFFGEPVTAFTNIRASLRPNSRLVMMVWQPAAQNAWAVGIHRALVDDSNALPTAQAGPSAFSLGDANATEGMLRNAGFAEVAFEAVQQPVFYGADVESALGFLLGFSNVTGVLAAQSVAERERTIKRLRELMAAHRTSDGVLFDSQSWIVTARAG